MLTWNNGGAGYTLAGGASTTFTYVVTVPSEYFGTYDDDGDLTPYEYRNIAIVRPEVGDNIELNAEVMITDGNIICSPNFIKNTLCVVLDFLRNITEKVNLFG